MKKIVTHVSDDVHEKFKAIAKSRFRKIQDHLGFVVTHYVDNPDLFERLIENKEAFELAANQERQNLEEVA